MGKASFPHGLSSDAFSHALTCLWVACYDDFGLERLTSVLAWLGNETHEDGSLMRIHFPEQTNYVKQPDAGPKPVLPLIALALLLAAWGASCLGQHLASRLDLSRFGPCEDVCESLARDGYVAKFELPYITAALLLDGLAVVALFSAGAVGRFGVYGLLVSILCLPTIAWHGLGRFVSHVFAGAM